VSSIFEKNLRARILAEVEPEGGLSAYTPGLKIQVVSKGRLKASLEMGETFLYYDLASLTKVIFATSAMMKIVEENRQHLSDMVSAHLPWWPHRTVEIAKLLSHSAGLPAWAPIYQSLQQKKIKKTAAKYDFLREFLAAQKLQRKPKSVYSDLDFLLLGFLIEEGFRRDLLGSWEHLGWNESLPSLHFCVNNKPKYARAKYAPTEKCPWRKKVLRGEVHDDNTWALGGVSSHAGLFGTIDDVTGFGLRLREGVYGRTPRGGRALAKAETIQKFTRRSISRAVGDWALGYMMPTAGSSSCGRYFSLTSVGHTGFTGTSLWFDPKADLLVTILSNRVHPTRDNRLFVGLRPRLHDLVFESLTDLA
jgi:CubicO group peptidase (beta-lactamase class C family)